MKPALFYKQPHIYLENWVTLFLQIFKLPSQTVGARPLKLSCVTCLMSHVTCYMSCVTSCNIRLGSKKRKCFFLQIFSYVQPYLKLFSNNTFSTWSRWLIIYMFVTVGLILDPSWLRDAFQKKTPSFWTFSERGIKPNSKSFEVILFSRIWASFGQFLEGGGASTYSKSCEVVLS